MEGSSSSSLGGISPFLCPHRAYTPTTTVEREKKEASLPLTFGRGWFFEDNTISRGREREREGRRSFTRVYMIYIERERERDKDNNNNDDKSEYFTSEHAQTHRQRKKKQTKISTKVLLNTFRTCGRPKKKKKKKK